MTDCGTGVSKPTRFTTHHVGSICSVTRIRRSCGIQYLGAPCAPDDKEFVIQQVLDYLEGRVDTFEVEMRMQHKDNARSDCALACYQDIARIGRERPVRLVGTHVDITERKQAESFIKNTSEILDDCFR